MQAARALRPAARRTLLGATRTFATSLPARTDRSPLTLKDHIYTAHATASGAGRNGVTKSVDSDAPIELKLATPKAMGGQGNGQNPEELFAMGYASCFLGALQLVASQAGKKEAAANAKIHAAVFIGPPKSPPLAGFGLRVDLNVEGVEDEKLIAAAHEFCPYSRMIKHGVEVNVKKL